MALDTPPLRPLWDIFCRVVDNLGDIGVCWRLARQLAAEYPVRVRLWVDAPEVLAPLLPAFDPALERQEIEGVRIARWQSPLVFEQVADVVIEAFACDPPAGYLAAMADRPRPPCWVNLEYLSAEPWVAGCHGLASPHRRLPLVKFFCFPGLVPGTGGLLREQDLLTRRDAFLAQEGPRRFLMELGLDRARYPPGQPVLLRHGSGRRLAGGLAGTPGIPPLPGAAGQTPGGRAEITGRWRPLASGPGAPRAHSIPAPVPL